MKRILGFAIIFTLMLSLTPVAAFASEGYGDGRMEVAAASDEFEYESDGDGGCEIIAYNGNAEDLTIPETIDGYTVTALGDHAFADNATLKKVTIPDTVTEMYFSAFCDCENLEEVVLSAGMTDIPAYAFDGCTKLKMITIPKSIEMIYDNAFSSCIGLETIYWGGSESEWYTIDFGSNNKSFLDQATLVPAVASATVELDISYDAQKHEVTLTATAQGGQEPYQYEFWLVDDDQYEVLQSYGDSSVFRWETELTGDQTFQVNVRDHYGSVTSATKTQRLRPVISDSDILTSGDWTYYKKSDNTIVLNKYQGSADDVMIPSELDGLPVSEIGYACFWQYGVESVTIPNGVKRIGTRAFYYCRGLSEIVFPETLEEIGYGAFGHCSALVNVNLPASVRVIDKQAFSFCSCLDSINLPDDLESIGDWAFFECYDLWSLTIPNGVKIGDHAIGFLSGALSESWNSMYELNENLELTVYQNSDGENYANMWDIPHDTIETTRLWDLEYTITPEQCIYDGTQQKPKIIFKDGSKVLTEGVDYSLSYANNINIGQASVTAVGKGLYAGTITLYFDIIGGSSDVKTLTVWNTTIGSIADQTYTGSEIEPLPAVTYNGIRLTYGTDYTVEYENNVNVGTAKVIISGNGKYKGTVTTTFRIKATTVVKKGWVSENGYWYFYNDDGTKAVNTWKKDSQGWCWLQADGRMLTNDWAKDSKGWCWIASNGHMPEETKWIKVDGSWYHITNGYRDQSKWMKDSIGWCYVGPDGKMVTNGWAKDSKGWCWMGADGYWVSNKWIQSGGQWYYIKANHYMAANEWAKDSGGWMYMDANGRITKSKWIKSGGYWYYLKSNGYMATGTQKIGGKTYKFDSAGRLAS